MVFKKRKFKQFIYTIGGQDSKTLEVSLLGQFLKKRGGYRI